MTFSNYPAGADTDNAPWNQPDAEEITFCTFCDEALKGEYEEGTFQPREADEDGEGFIHTKCIIPRIINSLTAEERFEAVKAYHALVILSEMPGALADKLDGAEPYAFSFRTMRDAAHDQLKGLGEDESLSTPDLVMVERKALEAAQLGLLWHVGHCQLELEGCENAKLTSAFTDIRRKDVEAATAAHKNLKVASHA